MRPFLDRLPRHLGLACAGLLLSAPAGALAPSQGCVPEWITTFDGMPGAKLPIHALAVFDDGAGGGPALYAGGEFDTIGGTQASRIAKWDGRRWNPLGSGIGTNPSDAVYALAVFDDGSGGGPALYAAGSFLKAGGENARSIAKWDGQSWSPLGLGLSGTVHALAVFDDGSGAGAALCAGGAFVFAGGAPANRIARWNGGVWQPLGSGLSGGSATVHALTVFDDGTGGDPVLVVGGQFTTAGGQSASRIAQWDGQGWSALGSGMAGTFAAVLALAVFDDGTGAGPALHAGGDFTTAGGQPANRVAKWDGQAWSALGSGIAGGSVNSLAVFDDGAGAGPALCAGGSFASAGGEVANRTARWDGQGWSPLGSGIGPFSVRALCVFDDASDQGPRLCAGGDFVTGGDGSSLLGIATWDGASWSAISKGLNGDVLALAAFDDGSGAGPALYAAGRFTSVAAQGANRIARWDGASWSALASGVGSGPFDAVQALAVFDDGTGAGPALYAGGHFTAAGGQDAAYIARWDGASWSALGSGLNDDVFALAVYDDGAGPALYAGGEFTLAGGQSANGIARWDGQAWTAVGGGMNEDVRALTVFDDGSGAGPALYASGEFTVAGGVSANRIARWDGQAWSALSSGFNLSVSALTAFDDGSGRGPLLHAAGAFTIAGGQSASRVARWDGGNWSALGSGVDAYVVSLTAFDDGSGAGPALYAGGAFDEADGQSANHIARWDGQAWSPLADGMNWTVAALSTFDDGSGIGTALFAGGAFDVSPGGDSFLARWACPAISAVPGCFGNPASLSLLSPEALIGQTFEVQILGGELTAGLGLLYLGVAGTSPAGCGLLAPGLGELLLALAPPPAQVGTGSLSGGALAFALPVPDAPGLVGLGVALQGVAVGALGPAVALELSNALLVTITQ